MCPFLQMRIIHLWCFVCALIIFCHKDIVKATIKEIISAKSYILSVKNMFLYV